MQAAIQFPPRQISQSELASYLKVRAMLENEARRIFQLLDAGASVEPGDHKVRVEKRFITGHRQIRKLVIE